MADIKFTGYVNKIRQVGTGTVVEVAEKHRRKNEATGEWENDGTATYYDVWVDRAQIEDGALVENGLATVEGSFRTKVSEKDGRKYYTNVVNAKVITKVSRGGASAPQGGSDWGTPSAALAGIGAVPVADAPF